MHWAKLSTLIVMGVCTAGLIGWDIYVAVNGIKGDTISEILQSWDQDYPMIRFAWGVLAGHLFWPQRKKVK